MSTTLGGRKAGRKDRPAAIVLTMQAGSNSLRVAVVPLTHSPPTGGSDAIPIPPQIKRHLALDDAPSWIVLDEMNVFQWPGPDLRPTGVQGNESALFGYLPAGFFRTVRDRVAANIRAGKLRQVGRTE